MKEVSLTDILHTLDIWHAEANNDHNDGYVQRGFKDKIDVVYNLLQVRRPQVKFEKTKEEMCF